MPDISGTLDDDTIRTAAAGGSLNGLPDASDSGDRIDPGEGNDLVLAGDGDDTILSSAGVDTLDGGSGTNTLDFSDATGGVAMVLAQDDLFDDGFGNQEKAYGFTVAHGSAWRDPLFAGSATGDSLFGAGGNDDVYGNGGDDTLHGGADDDLVVGEEGADVLYGEDGNDTLIGGRTDEASFDGGGIGLGQLADDGTPDTLEGGEGNDRLVLGPEPKVLAATRCDLIHRRR
jgi:Ca2+-binding RTX toxin-like protein